MEVNLNVNAANFLLVGNQTGSSSSNKSEPVDTKEFASFLEGATQNSQQSEGVKDTALSQDVQTSDEEKIANSIDDSSESTDKIVENNEQTDQSKETSEEKEVELSSDITDNVQVTEDIIITDLPIDGKEELSEEELTVVLETISNLMQSVMEQFDLTLEEFTAKLEEFGMEVSDLLSQDGLKTFFLQMNQAEVSDLVVDENLNMQLKTFMSETGDELETLESITSDVNALVSDEDIKELLTDFSKIENDVSYVEADVQSESVVTAEEPEVIVTNNKLQNDTNDSGNNQNQSESTMKQTSVQDITAVKDNVPVKDNAFENPILQAIQNAVNNVENVVVSEQPIQQVDVVRQIVEQVRLNLNQQATSLELQLYPEHLGRIQINVVSKEGVMTASIVAETESAKQAIEGGLLNLKEAMQQQDLKVEAIEVMVSTMGFEKNDEQQNSFENNNSSNARRKIDLSELNEEIPAEDEAEIEKMKATGSSVSYSA